MLFLFLLFPNFLSFPTPLKLEEWHLHFSPIALFAPFFNTTRIFLPLRWPRLGLPSPVTRPQMNAPQQALGPALYRSPFFSPATNFHPCQLPPRSARITNTFCPTIAQLHSDCRILAVRLRVASSCAARFVFATNVNWNWDQFEHRYTIQLF